MADTGPKLNYQLPQHVLNRVAKTTANDVFAPGSGSAIDDASKSMLEGLENIQEKKQLDAERRDLAMESYNKGLEERGERIDFHTPSTYDQIQVIETEKQAEFRGASKTDQERLLKEQATRGNSFARNKDAIELARTHAGDGDIDESTLTPQQLHMFGQITSQRDTQVVVNDNNEYEWKYRPMGWTEENGLDTWETASVRDIEKIVENNLKPYDQIKDFRGGLVNVANYVKKNPTEDYDSAEIYSIASEMINPNNIKQMLTNGEVWGTQGESFSQQFMEWKGFDNMELNLKYDSSGGMGAVDPNGDGILTTEELSRTDRESVIALLSEPENYDLARELLMDYAIERGRQQHTKFKAKPPSSPTSGMSAEEKLAYYTTPSGQQIPPAIQRLLTSPDPE